MFVSGPEVCPGTGEPSAGCERMSPGDMITLPTHRCPICETAQKAYPAERLPLFVLHRYPGPILCAGSGLPARMTDACRFCGRKGDNHAERGESGLVVCEGLIYANECGLCNQRVEVAGGNDMLAVAHARPGT